MRSVESTNLNGRTAFRYPPPAVKSGVLPRRPGQKWQIDSDVSRVKRKRRANGGLGDGLLRIAPDKRKKMDGSSPMGLALKADASRQFGRTAMPYAARFSSFGSLVRFTSRRTARPAFSWKRRTFWRRPFWAS